MLRSICILLWMFFAVMGAVGCIGGTIDDVKNGRMSIGEAFSENMRKLIIAEIAILVIMFIGYISIAHILGMN